MFTSSSSVRRLLQLSSALRKRSQTSFTPPPCISCHRHLCSHQQSPVIQVNPKVSLFDQDIKVKVQGLGCNVKVTLQASVHHEWKRKPIVFASYGHFITSADGQVDLERDSSLGGTFSGVDPQGLLWSLAPLPGHPTDIRLVWKEVLKPCDINLSVLPGHIVPSEASVNLQDPAPTPLASVVMSRWFKAQDVKRINIHEGRLRGTLFLPPGEGPFPGVIDMFGSAGGIIESRAALLASHGFATLSLAFFKYQDLPSKLDDIQMDYFEEGVEWFSGHPSVRKCGIGVVSVSFGATFAMLMAMQCPQVKAVVQINGPPFLINRDLQRKGEVFVKKQELDRKRVVYTEKGVKVKDAAIYTTENILPMWQSSAHMLCLASDDDGMNNPAWFDELRDLYPENRRHLIQVAHFPNAGHLLEPPYTPHCYSCPNAGEGDLQCIWGGNAKEHSEAQKKAWKLMRDFLHEQLAG